MSQFLDRLPADVSRALALHARRGHRSVEEVAIAALARGLAFTQDAEEEPTWVEAPQFDEALRAFADMDRE
jgi:hypothetical protein